MVTRSTAGPAQAGVTGLALLRARAAEPSLAAGAGFEAIEAQLPIASFAKRSVVLGNRAAAISAGTSFPFGERAIRAAAVVGIEDLAHDLEKIGQSTREQRAANGLLPVPLAQRLIPDVGMSHVVRLGRRIWTEGDDVEAPMLTDALPTEPNRKRSEIDVFQHDALGGHRDRPAIQLEADLVELAEQSGQLLVDSDLAIASPWSRTDWCPPAEFEEVDLTEHVPDEDAKYEAFREYAALRPIDWIGIRNRIDAALLQLERLTLGQLVAERHPGAQVVDLIGYLETAQVQGHLIDRVAREELETITSDGAGQVRRLRVTVPLVTFSRRPSNGR
jgi:hypothetical protein